MKMSGKMIDCDNGSCEQKSLWRCWCLCNDNYGNDNNDDVANDDGYGNDDNYGNNDDDGGGDIDD